MKRNQSEVFRVVAVLLTLIVTASTTPCLATADCTDLDGFSVPCPEPHRTLLDPATQCTDLDGFSSACASQQPTLLLVASACTDLEGFKVPCGNQMFTTVARGNRHPDYHAVRFTAGHPLIDHAGSPNDNTTFQLSQGENPAHDKYIHGQ